MRWLIVLILLGMVATCGQKGPLYLPDSEASLPYPSEPEL